MTYRIQEVRALDARRLDILWTDGLRGTVDFGRFIAELPGYAPLADADLFRAVRLYEHGHSLFWVGPDGMEIDICPDVLRAEIDPDVAAWIAETEAGGVHRSAAE